jgi:CheY-like chemotaxis protein
MPRILTVEDDLDLQFLYDMMLSRHGYEVVRADNTTEALYNLTNSDFDLIVLDMNMPDIPGIRVIEFAREDVRLRHVPILVVSANDHWKKKAMNLGVRHFLTKPVPMEQLVREVNDLLNNGH